MQVEQPAAGQDVVGGHPLSQRVHELGGSRVVVEHDRAADDQVVGDRLQRGAGRRVVVRVDEREQDRHLPEPLRRCPGDVAGDQLHSERLKVCANCGQVLIDATRVRVQVEHAAAVGEPVPAVERDDRSPQAELGGCPREPRRRAALEGAELDDRPR